MYPLALHRTYRKRQFFFWAVFILIVVAIVWTLSYYSYEYFSRGRTYEELIRAAADRHGIDSRLLKAVIWQESRFNRYARGGKGEVGLMQIMPGPKHAVQDWATGHKEKLPCIGLLYNPSLNIEIGAWFLSRSLSHWRKYDAGIELALCEYNAGYSKAKTWCPPTYDGDVMDRISYTGTRGYVQAIMDKYREYLGLTKEQE